MMSKNRQYDNDFKVQAVKLAKEIGTEKAAKELNVPSNTLYGWVKKAKVGGLDIGLGERSPEDALNIAEENQQLKKKIKAMEKEIKRLNEMNEFLECSCCNWRCCLFFCKSITWKSQQSGSDYNQTAVKKCPVAFHF